MTVIIIKFVTESRQFIRDHISEDGHINSRVALFTHPEEGGSGSATECSVLDFGLFGQILSRFDGRVHTLDGEEGSQVGGVRGDHDQGEEPPHALREEEIREGGSIFKIL